MERLWSSGLVALRSHFIRSHIHWNFERASDTPNATLLQSAKQFRLHAYIELGNLIEE